MLIKPDVLIHLHLLLLFKRQQTIFLWNLMVFSVSSQALSLSFMCLWSLCSCTLPHRGASYVNPFCFINISFGSCILTLVTCILDRCNMIFSSSCAIALWVFPKYVPSFFVAILWGVMVHLCTCNSQNSMCIYIYIRFSVIHF